MAVMDMPPVKDPIQAPLPVPLGMRVPHPKTPCVTTPMALGDSLEADVSRLVVAMLLDDLRQFPNLADLNADHAIMASSPSRSNRAKGAGS
jgi:hypothetical protein